MKAKDTVMSGEQRGKAMKEAIDEDPFLTYPTRGERESVLLPAQAEISFKAGIGEMVDLLKRYYNFALECEEIKAQLEEWGIKW